MKKRLNTFLFDLDGTLVNTNEIIIKSYQHAYSKHLPNLNLDRDTIISDIGPPLRAIFNKYTTSQETVEKLIETYLEYYVANEHDVFYLYPGVEDTLKKLKEQGHNLAIVTSKFRSSAQPSIDHFNLEDYFNVIVTLDDVRKPKPDSEAIHKALNHFDNVEKAIMVGDNDSDILAGQNADILSAGVAWSIKGETFLKQVKPDYMLKTIHDIFKIIDYENGER